MICNMGEVAELFGVNDRLIRLWVRRGCPFLEKGGKGGRAWQFETADVIAWREQQAAIAAVGDVSTLDVDEARRRKLAAEAALSELQLSKEKGDVISLDEIERIWLDMASNCRGLLLSLPSKMAPIVLPETDLRTVRDLLTDEIEEALAELGRFECGDTEGSPPAGDGDSQPGVSTVPAAAAADG